MYVYMVVPNTIHILSFSVKLHTHTHIFLCCFFFPFIVSYLHIFLCYIEITILFKCQKATPSHNLCYFCCYISYVCLYTIRRLNRIDFSKKKNGTLKTTQKDLFIFIFWRRNVSFENNAVEENLEFSSILFFILMMV